MTPAEAVRPQEFLDRAADMHVVAAYFRERPLQEIEQAAIERLVGAAALRTRVSDCRVKLGMRIDTIPTFYVGADGKRHRGLSRYMFVPYEPLGREAGAPAQQKTLFG